LKDYTYESREGNSCLYKYFYSALLFEPNQCSAVYPYYDYTLISVRPCSLGYACEKYDIEVNPLSYCIKETNLLPGEYCTSDKSCLSNKCHNNICKGKKELDNCSNHSDCDVSLYCNERNKCETQKYLANDQCISDYQCYNNKACFNNKCIEYFSLNDGDKSNNRLLCKSLFIYNGYCRTANFFNKSNEIVMKSCRSNDECKFKYNQNNKDYIGNSECICLNWSLVENPTQAICYQSPINAENILKKITNLNKHTYNRFDLTLLTVEEIVELKSPHYDKSHLLAVAYKEKLYMNSTFYSISFVLIILALII
jgi:hypothetical protein